MPNFNPSAPVGVPDCVIVLLNHLEDLMDKGELAEDAIPVDMWNAVSMYNLTAAISALTVDEAMIARAEAYMLRVLPDKSTACLGGSFNFHELLTAALSNIEESASREEG